MEDSRVLRALRTQAWERAKGELNSMLHTFYTNSSVSSDGQYNAFANRLNEFIRDIEDNGLNA
jgi:hypothetical protein